MANDDGVQPGWYADPLRRFELRWFNGSSWTADVASSDERFVDPLGILPDISARPSVSPGALPGATDPSSSSNGRATAAMTCGIVAVAVSWMPFLVVIGVVAAIVAIALGATALRRTVPGGVGRGRAVVGIATGASALLVAAIGIVFSVIVLDAVNSYLEPAPNEVTITSCEQVGSRVNAIGTVENLGSEQAGYSVLIGFAEPGSDIAEQTVRIAVDDVAPGELGQFEAQGRVDLDAVDCIVIEVNGPLPFGVALD